MLLKDKCVIVTGGSRGIGAGISRAMAQAGADVVINYLGENDAELGQTDGIEVVLADIKAMGRRAIAVEGNVADPETGQKLVDAAVEAFGKVDILSSNAGICPFHSFLDIPIEVMRKVSAVNYEGSFMVSQAVARQMVKQGHGGAIIATSSISALVGGEMQTHYTPTKAAVHSMMQSVSISLGKHGIRCNSIMPGAILTDMNREVLDGTETAAYFEKRIPLGRYGTPDDIGQVAVFLASDMASYVTGASLLVDGGMFVNLQ
ncbi:MAG: SDR family oxidoreductase [Rhizobiales bacterium]|nr:SDR family oxidoreductase [Hyphomicrobiales bacterium]NRB15437.1 SDR family oxidoreductase [Hyphomicrobiales bacterium]